MCTAITFNSDNFYFGRSMDVEQGFGERVVITPRRFPLSFASSGTLSEHRAIMGMATVIDGYPLYADAFNESGLCMAGLNFPDNAHYFPAATVGKRAVCSFELIPFILASCKSLAEAKSALEGITVTDAPFNENTPATPLHWIIADKTGALTVEQTSDGMHIYENDVGALTNNPPFPFHQTNVTLYANLSQEHSPSGVFSDLPPLSLGLGSHGLSGDFSSPSRFVRAAYLLRTSEGYDDADEEAKAARFFNILAALSVPKGAVLARDGRPHFTHYCCCINTDAQIYYHKRHDRLNVTAHVMTQSDILGKELKELI